MNCQVTRLTQISEIVSTSDGMENSGNYLSQKSINDLYQKKYL